MMKRRKSIPLRMPSRFGLSVLGFAVALSAVGCGSTKPAPPITAPSASPSASSAPSLAVPTASGPNACPPPKSGFQKGVAVLWDPQAATADSAQQAHNLATYARSVGANSLSVNYLVSVGGSTSNKVYAGPKTTSVAALKQLIEAAKGAGLRVVLRPLVDESNIVRPQWRGTLAPTDPSAWFKSYGDLMATYAKLAQSTCVDEFTIGAELNSMQANTAGWTSVAEQVRAAGYHGDLSYAANWDAPVTFNFGNHPGLDFYPNLKISESATVSELTTAMIAVFRAMPAAFHSGVVIQEAGISAVGTTYAASSAWSPSGAPTPDKQKTWFQAVCNTAKQINASGLYYWGLTSYSNPLKPNASVLGTFAFEGRPAAQVVRSCFAQF